ncbi:type I-B CRISPR-associated protein Cas5 [Adhaeribacter arboris]|uniref:Type I-B CRISPR-associated protein Cas5 n=1 Tax=Adhaeribacter arboris TaxID=2072846 RepID=A0A2T2YHE8_9BACT|nr:type I-B CRISPR-associated protein Cas5b [Adhaeribacter arboris]PSR54933.1 type I-B CRISPR-associated protein Cas5 [Adhaeribacter arboris]
MQTVLSFDLESNFGFFKKPDINDNKRAPYLTYNILHKPALLGILGAIIGLKGFERRGELPEYYQQLKHLQTGIQPLNHQQGNFTKTLVKYNNSVGYASQEEGGNLIVTETMLIRPAYRCYVALNTAHEPEAKLHKYLLNQQAEFIPYLGKNEFTAWWQNVQEYPYQPFNAQANFKLLNLFQKPVLDSAVSKIIIQASGRNYSETRDLFLYFERLPSAYDEILLQYTLSDYVFTNALFPKETSFPGLFALSATEAVQLN